MPRKLKKAKIIVNTESRKVFDKAKITDTIGIRGYDLSCVKILSIIESYKNIINLSALTMVTVIMLCQFRSLRPSVSSARLDRSPSFKTYKKRIIVKHPGKALALSLACAIPEVNIYLPTDPVDLEPWMIDIMQCHMGNERILSAATEDNASDFIAGHMSRIIGILQSCPSSCDAFNVTTDVVTWDIDDVLKRLPDPLSTVQKEDIIDLFKSCISDPDAISSFPENPYEGSNSIEGGSKIEHELWKGNIPVRTMGSKNLRSIKIDLSAAQEVLNPLEFRQYDSALKINKKELIVKYQKIIKDRSENRTENEETS